MAKIVATASFLPDRVLGNEELADLYPGWTADKIFDKTGIRERRIAAADETAGDLAAAAARRLFTSFDVDPGSIDFLILCTQTPDFLLPTTACLLQAELGLGRHCGALDVNLGCSGFVYGLALAKGLIETGTASRVLLLTADTYSKLIHPQDRSVRTLFGDGAAATLIDTVAASEPAIGPFVFGTDGAGGDKLVVPAGGMRRPADAETAVSATDSLGNTRSLQNLFMSGADILSFTLQEIPKAVARLLEQVQLRIEDFDLFLFHQANSFILEKLRRKLDIPADRLPIHMAHCGNTVSSSIPIVLEHVMRQGGSGRRAMVVGFGVGLSWSAAAISF